MGAMGAGLGGAGNGGCSGHHRIFNRLLCFALAELAGLFCCLFRHCTASKPGGEGVGLPGARRYTVTGSVSKKIYTMHF